MKTIYDLEKYVYCEQYNGYKECVEWGKRIGHPCVAEDSNDDVKSSIEEEAEDSNDDVKSSIEEEAENYFDGQCMENHYDFEYGFDYNITEDDIEMVVYYAGAEENDWSLKIAEEKLEELFDKKKEYYEYLQDEINDYIGEKIRDYAQDYCEECYQNEDFIGKTFVEMKRFDIEEVRERIAEDAKDMAYNCDWGMFNYYYDDLVDGLCTEENIEGYLEDLFSSWFPEKNVYITIEDDAVKMQVMDINNDDDAA